MPIPTNERATAKLIGSAVALSFIQIHSNSQAELRPGKALAEIEHRPAATTLQITFLTDRDTVQNTAG